MVTMMKRWIVCAGLLTLACGSPTQPDQSTFVLAGTWEGNLASLGGGFLLGDLNITLEGRRDGATEEYRGEGLLIRDPTNFRFQQIEADYDTTAGTIEMAIFDFPGGADVFIGNFDGALLNIADTLICRCQASLSRR